MICILFQIKHKINTPFAFFNLKNYHFTGIYSDIHQIFKFFWKKSDRDNIHGRLLSYKLHSEISLSNKLFLNQSTRFSTIAALFLKEITT